MDTKIKKTNKRRFEGVVVSDKMQKTRVVEVSRRIKHPRYHKYYRVTKRFSAHDENNIYMLGESVIIEEAKPLSRTKRWVIVEKVTKK